MQVPMKNGLEWTVFALGLALVLATLGFLGWDMATHKDRPPELRVTLGEPRAEGGHYSVPVTVENTGDRTAEGVQVEVTLSRDGQEETAAFTMAFVPRKSSRDGFVTFDEDPRAAGKLEARAVGYEVP